MLNFRCLRFREWASHVRTVLPDLKEIRTMQRDDDRHCDLVVRYSNGLEVPSWVVSDGTLRLLALTLPAYLERLAVIYLNEEPDKPAAQASEILRKHVPTERHVAELDRAPAAPDRPVFSPLPSLARRVRVPLR